MKKLHQLFIFTTCFLSTQNFVYSYSDTDVTAGEYLYAQCSGCHSPGYHRTGPKHCGLLGRRAGSIAEYEFTPDMKDSGIIWTYKTLNKFLKAPLDMIPNTSMGFSGIASDKERRQLIKFLSTLTEKSPLCR